MNTQQRARKQMRDRMTREELASALEAAESVLDAASAFRDAMADWNEMPIKEAKALFNALAEVGW